MKALMLHIHFRAFCTADKDFKTVTHKSLHILFLSGLLSPGVMILVSVLFSSSLSVSLCLFPLVLIVPPVLISFTGSQLALKRHDLLYSCTLPPH